MTQRLGRRLEVTGTLVCRSALSIGGWEESLLADTAVTRDGTGRYVVPGTSLAGALRSWYVRHRGAVATDAVFGFMVAGTQHAGPSRIRVDDAPLRDGHPPVDVQVRDGVRIDRRTGSAADGLLFTREVLPPGTEFTFRLSADETDGDAEHGPVATAVREVVSALVQGDIDLGGRITQGLGRVQLRDATVAVSDLGSRDGLLAWLRHGPQRAAFNSMPVPASGRLHVEIRWRPRRAVLVRDSSAGDTVDALPLTARDVEGNVRLLLPGSSIKGTLRAHAETIVRTLGGADAAPANDREVLPAVATLFGTSPGTTGDRLASGYRGNLRVEDCHSTGFVTAETWAQVQAPRAAGPQPNASRSQDPHERRMQANAERLRARVALDARLRDLPPGLRLQVSDHVAVDRWTGGAAPGRLFSVLEPMGTAWEPIRLSIDTRARPAPSDGWRPDDADVLDHDLQLVLLLLLLRDFADGWVPLGSGITRGLGHVTVERISFTGDAPDGPWPALGGLTLDDVLTSPPPRVTTALESWRRRMSHRPSESGGPHA